MTLRTALFFQANNFIGREYLHRMSLAGKTPDLVATVGRMSSESITFEQKRTGGLWNPPNPDGSIPIDHYDSLSEDRLWKRVNALSIDVIIQGGIGILKPEMLAVPRVGFLNIHPGRLPGYRGNSCPEWALFNGSDVYATAHLIDANIDTGPTICESRYEIKVNWDYFDFRAHLYHHCSKVLIQALSILENSSKDLDRILTPQDEEESQYWPPIPSDKLDTVINSFGSLR